MEPENEREITVAYLKARGLAFKKQADQHTGKAGEQAQILAELCLKLEAEIADGKHQHWYRDFLARVSIHQMLPPQIDQKPEEP